MKPGARRVRIDLAYDGTDFAGWQLQRGQRTVQGVLESVLGQIQGGGRVVVGGAGRTDAGVHASHQVADAALVTRLDDGRLERALSRMLPGDVRPLRVATTSPRFHARKHALAKTYRYRLDLSRHGSPFEARYALHYPHRLDLDRVQAALAELPGRRDWSGFAASSCDKADRVRELTLARLERLGEARRDFVFRADGFLQHMVRNLVGTLLEIGGGRKPLAVLGEMLERGDRGLGGPTAAARGLWLVGVRYADDPPEADATGAAAGRSLYDGRSEEGSGP